MKKALYIFISCIFIINANLISQPVTNFTISEYRPCAPVNITFINTTTGCSSNSDRHWQAGTGDEAWNRDTVTFSYTVGGNYSVSLKVTCNGHTDTKVINIRIYDSPTANITNTTIKGCAPFNLTFEDLSVQGGAPINSWRWYFGDGVTSNLQNPNHTYQSSNNYSVTLIITDENSCSSQVTRDNIVSVANPPVISFFADVAEWCIAPHNVNFTSTVSTSFGLGYNINWDFGDGSPNVIGNNVNHIYNTLGNYTVSTVVTDTYGCSTIQTIPNYIKLKQPVASYSVSKLNACLGENITFHNMTTYPCSWNFGEGNTSTYNIAQNTYNSSGTHPVIFTVNPGTVCEVSITFDIHIEEAVIASFITNPAPENDTIRGCNIPFSVEFINTSSDNAHTFIYSFNPYNPSENGNITHVFNSSAITQLTVRTLNGCSSTFVGPVIEIINNHVLLVADTVNGCLPLNVNFSYEDLTIPNENIENCTWSFGNGDIVEVIRDTVNYTYEEPGIFIASVAFTDINGCIATYSIPIQVGTEYHPIIELIASNDSICHTENVMLHMQDNHDTCSFNCNHLYKWSSNSSDNEALVCDTTIMEYKPWELLEHSGWTYFSLLTIHSECQSTTPIIDSVYVYPILSKGGIIDSISCGNIFDRNFSIINPNSDSRDWKIYKYIDDSQTNLIHEELDFRNNILNYLFSETGRYLIEVTCKSDIHNCVSTSKYNLLIENLKISYNPRNLCANTYSYFSSINSSNFKYYKWDFGDGDIIDWDTTTNNIHHNYSEGGDYIIKLYVKDEFGCIDSVSETIFITTIDIDILTENNQGCNRVNAVFTDASVTNDEIVSWIWTFHDNTELPGNSVTHQYSSLGTYNVKLTVETNTGCKLSRTYPNIVRVSSINSNFQSNLRTICAGDSICFIAEESSEGYSYTWNFGDNIEITTDNNSVYHTFLSGGVFNISLLIDNNYSCINKTIIDSLINVEKPYANINFSETVFSCYPAELSFEPIIYAEPEGINYSYVWNMGNNINIHVLNPEYIYTRPGEYDIILTVSTPNCTNKDTLSISVKGPHAEVAISDNHVCKNQEILFQLYNAQNVDSFKWILGDGNEMSQELFTYSYDSIPGVGYYNADLYIYYGSCEVVIKNNIHIYDVKSNFKVLDLFQNEIQAACSPLNVNLDNQSSNDILRKWYVNGETYGNGRNSEFIFDNNTNSEDKTINISLTIESVQGCKDSISKDIIVYALPQISISNDTLICFGDEAMLSVIGNSNNEWSPNEYISDIYSNNPVVNPKNDIYYSVLAKNEKNCYAKDSVLIMVHQEPEVYFLNTDTTIYIGESFQINLTTNQDEMKYSWAPNYSISCIDCPSPYLKPLETTTYTITIEDSIKCFTYNFPLKIIVDEVYTLDIPSAFTPQSSDNNNIVYVRGHGIKELKQFRIFNRWGEEVFFSNDINIGWDGYFNGKLQNMDNYSYFVEIETYQGVIKNKKGQILLLK